ncbi:MAG TPA: hypothetical protein VGH38_20605 [Bryobacteraceae bacterium]|jgi:hypothetical protein
MTNDIDEVIEFIGARDPEFVKQIRGASSVDLDRLERAMKKPLLDIERQFLERMGRGSSWLKLGNAQFDVDSLIRYYEYYGNTDPDRHWLIGRSQADPNYDFYLWEENDGNVRVVSFPPAPKENFAAFVAKHRLRVAGSLPQLIGDKALTTFCHHRMPHHRQVEDLDGKPQSRLDQFDALLRGLGAPPLWFSNDWMRSYESPEALVNAYEVPGKFRLIVDVRAATQKEFDRIYPEVRALVKAR